MPCTSRRLQCLLCARLVCASSPFLRIHSSLFSLSIASLCHKRWRFDRSDDKYWVRPTCRHLCESGTHRSIRYHHAAHVEAEWSKGTLLIDTLIFLLQQPQHHSVCQGRSGRLGPKKVLDGLVCGPVKRARLTLATDTMSLTDDLASCYVLHSSIPWIRTWTLRIML